jgi:hypothetical protein
MLLHHDTLTLQLGFALVLSCVHLTAAALSTCTAALQVGIALVASVLRARHGRIEPVERVSVQPKGRSYSRTLFARGT